MTKHVEILPEDIALAVADFFSAFSDMSRVRILSAILSEEMNVGEIASNVGISESAVSHHLRNLRQLRIVKMRKMGRQVFYSLDDDHIIHIFNTGLDHILHE